MPGEIVYDDGEFFIQQASPREYILLRRVLDRKARWFTVSSPLWRLPERN